jgi:eukaryotic-like serine/threonine-protein kinase
MMNAPVSAPPTAIGVPVASKAAAPKKKGKGPIVAVIILVAVLIGVVAYLLVTQLGDDGGGGDAIEVQSVVGQPVGPARTFLEAQGFKVTVRQRPNDQIGEGLVVRQDPAAGTKVDKGEAILLTVSSGAGNVRVPDVEGLTFEAAQAQLTAKGLKAVRKDEASDTVDPGVVIGTNPPAAATVKRNSEVSVAVSAGPAPVNVPNVANMDQVEATQTLNSAGFRVQKATAASASVPSGSVIDTNPAAGTQAARNSLVTVNVSTGPEQVAVPNVIGRTQSDATAALTGAGFNVTVVQVPSSSSNMGRVITQSPDAGTTVDRGTQVTITVGTGPSGSTTTSTT